MKIYAKDPGRVPDWLRAELIKGGEIFVLAENENPPEDALFFDEGQLVLVMPPPQKPLKVDFSHPAYQRNLKDPPGRSSLIGKAVGHNKGYTKLIDATAGFGSDLWLFYCMGFQCVGVERAIEPFLLLLQATVAQADHLFELHFGEAFELLPALQANFQAEVIFFDFLFSQAKKGRSRKTMEVLHRVSSADSIDREIQLIERACCLSPRPARITVKRPLHWKGPKAYRPRHCFKGNGIRYDIF